MPAGYKLTVNDFKKRIFDIFGDKLELDESTFVNSTTKCRFIHSEFGEKWALPFNVSNGALQFKVKRFDSKISMDKIKERIKIVHGDIVTIVESTYIDTHTKCSFNDIDYGTFEAIPKDVYGPVKVGHRDRGYKRRGENNTVKFGGPSPTNDPVIRQKQIDTIFENYGVKSIFELPNFIEKVKQTNLKKFGVEWSMQSPIVVAKGRATSLLRYGKENHMQTKEGQERSLKGTREYYKRINWESKEEFLCQGTWEAQVVDYLNVRKIKFKWKPEIFDIPLSILTTKSGRKSTYTPDLYLIDSDKWIEIKGWINREQSNKIKWEWFHANYSNSELWNEEKLNEMGMKMLGKQAFKNKENLIL